GSTLGAISLAVLTAVMICILAAGRFGGAGGALDYAGPNLAPNQLIVYPPNGPNPGGPGPDQGQGQDNRPQASQKGGSPGTPAASTVAALERKVNGIASSLGTHKVLTLEMTDAGLQRAAPGRSWSGPLYVATPQLLAAFGIKASQIQSNADII